MKGAPSDPAAVSSSLKQMGISEALAEEFGKCYQVHKRDLSAIKGALSISSQRYKDLTWRLLPKTRKIYYIVCWSLCFYFKSYSIQLVNNTDISTFFVWDLLKINHFYNGLFIYNIFWLWFHFFICVLCILNQHSYSSPVFFSKILQSTCPPRPPLLRCCVIECCRS